MPHQHLSARRTKPGVADSLELTVLRTERISPHFVRITLGGGDIGRSVPLGFDQWFRLFIPVSDESLARVPAALGTLEHVRFLAVPTSIRPVLRSHTVRAYRPDGVDGPEIDVDFVLHGAASTDGALVRGDRGVEGPASTWAQSCSPGDRVPIIDEGVGFSLPDGITTVMLVGDECALPAVAGILASLPPDTTGFALIEMPAPADRQLLDQPDAVELTWVQRRGEHATLGASALAAALAAPVPRDDFYGWVAGEQQLPVMLRRPRVRSGVPKERITFCGYWRAAR